MNNFIKISLGLLLLAILIPLAQAGAAMFFGKTITVYPFSGFEGQLFHKGQPAAHAKIRRTYNWDGDTHEEVIEADEQGRFKFDSISVETKESLVQFVSDQHVHVDFDGASFEIWDCGKLAKGEFAEFGGEPKNLRCEITDDSKSFQLPLGFASSNCTWDT